MLESHSLSKRLTERPQLTTGPRLLKLGEAMEFQFSVPAGVDAGDLSIFPRYLEQAGSDINFSAADGLGWIEAQTPEVFPVAFTDSSASFTYRPSTPGNYMARWTAGGEVFHRYFAIIEDDSIVLRFSSFIELESEPTLHSTGIPMDYRLPIEQFEEGDQTFEKLLGYHRLFGDAVTPEFPDTPPTGSTAQMTNEDRARQYGAGLERVRALLPDDSDARSARVQLRHAIDPGYVGVFEKLGLNDHFGLQESNILPWLGMPEFPYFASPNDFRKSSQGQGGSVVSHTWDFCAGFHFIGPISWHYAVSEGDFDQAETCIRHGMDDLQNMTELSGYPAFANPLYDGATKNYGSPNGQFNEGYGGDPILEFVDRWQQMIAFKFTAEYKLVFARSIDIADYYRRHFNVTPRTVFSSKSDHPLYDMWWNCTWGREGILTTRDRIPRQTRMSTIMKQRRSGATVSYVNLVSGKEVTAQAITKDPLSSEHLLIEDQHRSLRFERESPNPIWWFDYTVQERGELGSEISHTETPDVEVIQSEWSGVPERTVSLKIITEAEFPDYAVAIWGVPAKFSLDRSRIKTNAKDFVLARNRDGEFHIILYFDLKPDVELTLTVLDSGANSLE
ncbi:MAG: hypothetical protein HQ478_14870 [Chloroflexi bacterium]|nr:hypothetical protein [Chloroflexota bacterium]